MPMAIPAWRRHDIWQRAQQGQSAQAIAQALRLSERSVRRLLARFRLVGQPTAPYYQRCGRPLCLPFSNLREEVLALRRLHPCWGAGRIRVELRQHHPQQQLPGQSTLRRWLARAGLASRSSRLPRPAAPRASRPHEIWQMDAKEAILLRNGQRVCWLRLVDEATGAVLFSLVFTKERWAEVGEAAVQAALRQAFARWGRPWGLRVDNGVPWVSPEASLPSELELWLAGLGVALYRNRVRCPQDNGKVERSQRTANAWAEPILCDTPEQLQQRLDHEDRVQRQFYPVQDGQSRLDIDPDLLHSGRGYALGSWEFVCWDLEAALACLGSYKLQRKVDRAGKVSLYDHRHTVGAAYRGQLVQVGFEAASREWVFHQQEQELGRSFAGYIAREQICGLQVSRRPDRARRRKQARAAKEQEDVRGGPAAEEHISETILLRCWAETLAQTAAKAQS